jgi:hypothetical protein
MINKCYFLPNLKKLVQAGIPKFYRVSVSSPSNSRPWAVLVSVHNLLLEEEGHLVIHFKGFVNNL